MGLSFRGLTQPEFHEAMRRISICKLNATKGDICYAAELKLSRLR